MTDPNRETIPTRKPGFLRRVFGTRQPEPTAVEDAIASATHTYIADLEGYGVKAGSPYPAMGVVVMDLENVSLVLRLLRQAQEETSDG